MKSLCVVVAGAAMSIGSMTAAAGAPARCPAPGLVGYATDRIHDETRQTLAGSARVQLAALRSELATQMALGGAPVASPTVRSGP